MSVGTTPSHAPFTDSTDIHRPLLAKATTKERWDGTISDAQIMVGAQATVVPALLESLTRLEPLQSCIFVVEHLPLIPGISGCQFEEIVRLVARGYHKGKS